MKKIALLLAVVIFILQVVRLPAEHKTPTLIAHHLPPRQAVV